MVFLFDSLERLRGPEEKFHATMESVVRVLTQYPDYLRLPGCHVVYTVPPYALLLNPDLQRYDGTSRVLPSIKVLEKGPELTPSRPGIEAMTTLVRRRIPVARIFEDEALLEELIISSGGHVRTLLVFLTDLLTPTLRTGLPVGRREIDRVLALHRDRVRTSIRPEGIPVLDSIRRLASLDEVTHEQLGLLARYIDTHVVLCYQNGEGWYEVNPLVRDHIAARARAVKGETPDPS